MFAQLRRFLRPSVEIVPEQGCNILHVYLENLECRGMPFFACVSLKCAVKSQHFACVLANCGSQVRRFLRSSLEIVREH
jgi:hypothetical protein